MGKMALGECAVVFSKRLSCRSGWGGILLISALVLGSSTSTGADSFAEQEKRLEADYALERPEGNGPFPPVMMVPGCSGFAFPSWKGRYARVAKKLKNLGYVVIKVDYLDTRGKSRCTHVDQEEAAQDIATTAKYLRAQFFVKATAINVIGWSFGGGMALIALSEGNNRSLAPVNALVAYFPFFRGSPPPWKADVPVLIFYGDKDTTAPPSKCKDLLAQVPTRDRVKFLVYPDAYHAFDNSDLSTEIKPGGTMAYNEKAAKDAWEEVERFLRR